MRINILPDKGAYAAMMDSNSDLLRAGADNLARPGLTVCDLVHLREAVHDRWWHKADLERRLISCPLSEQSGHARSCDFDLFGRE